MGRKRGQSNEVLSMEAVRANSRAVHTGRNNRGGVWAWWEHMVAESCGD